MTAAVRFEHVDIVFGEKPEAACTALDRGKGRAEILAEMGNVIGVHDATLDVGEGEICVLMGLSGSGKSTLLRAVNGLNRPIRGKVLVDEGGSTVDVATCDATTLRRLRTERIAMVFQQFALLPWRTVAENVGFGLELSGVPMAERQARVRKQLDLVNLGEWAGKYAHELSGGMQQRVGLARAFATEAPILLMDEPFSALDPLIRARLQDELLEFQKGLKRTIIFVSHDLDEALKIGSKIAIMEDGRIVQHGRAEDIVLKPATRYVADFVANMNPLRVLRGAALMRPVEGDTYGLNISGNGNGLTVMANGRPLTLLPINNEDGLSEDRSDAIAVASPDILMWCVIEARHHTGQPVLLVDDGNPVGIIGDDEIYRGILRQTAGGA